MDHVKTLAEVLETWAGGDALKRDLAATVGEMSIAAVAISKLIAAGPLAGDLAEIVGDNAGGDQQKALDVTANELLLDALARASVAVIGSEESDEPVALDAAGTLCVAIDPLDGSSNIDTNISIGTIFSIYAMAGAGNGSALSAVLQKGSQQLAAGFFIYGPQTSLVLSVGEGTDFYTLDRDNGVFLRTRSAVRIVPGKHEFAINASNYRHWPDPVRRYIDDCLAGVDGPRGANYNTRWVASLVAEAFRILTRGGIFLYPADSRPGYGAGRLRLVYEANAIAMLMEQAGGSASDGTGPILEIPPKELHQRTALVFGDADEVACVEQCYVEPPGKGSRSPLFGERGLFRG